MEKSCNGIQKIKLGNIKYDWVLSAAINDDKIKQLNINIKTTEIKSICAYKIDNEQSNSNMFYYHYR